MGEERAEPDRSGPVLPLAAWELRRLARSGDVLRTRLLVGGVLLLALAGVALAVRADFGDPTSSSRIGQPFARAIVLVQLVGVLLLAPGYGAAAVAGEKDRRTLETLLSTPLSHRAIVVGKFLARAAFVVTLVLLGLPVTAISLTLGGVEPPALLASYAVALGTAVLLTAIGLLAGTKSGELRGAMVRAYGWSALYVFTLGMPWFWVASPVFVGLAPMFTSGRDQNIYVVIGLGYAAIQLCAAGRLVSVAVANLRREEDYRAAALFVPPKPILDEPPVSPDLPPEEMPVAPFFVPAARGPKFEPGHWLDYNPLWWKERYITGHLPAFRGPAGRKLLYYAKRGAALFSGLFLALGLGASMSGGSGDATLGRFLLLLSGTVSGAACLTAVGCAAANAVAGERQRRTLDALLSLPQSRADVLAVKWGAAWANGGAWLPFAAFALFVSLVGHGVVLLGGVVLLVISACVLLATFGVWVSVRSETPGRAIRLVLPAVLAATALPACAWLAADPSGWTEANAWLGVVLVGAAGGLLVMNWVLWRDAVRRLDEGVGPRRVPVRE